MARKPTLRNPETQLSKDWVSPAAQAILDEAAESRAELTARLKAQRLSRARGDAPELDDRDEVLV